jgi:hypothetical protein
LGFAAAGRRAVAVVLEVGIVAPDMANSKRYDLWKRPEWGKVHSPLQWLRHRFSTIGAICGAANFTFRHWNNSKAGVALLAHIDVRGFLELGYETDADREP